MIAKRKQTTNRLEKPFKNSDFFKCNLNEHFLQNKRLQFSLLIVKETLENK